MALRSLWSKVLFLNHNDDHGLPALHSLRTDGDSDDRLFFDDPDDEAGILGVRFTRPHRFGTAQRRDHSAPPVSESLSLLKNLDGDSGKSSGGEHATK
jgi:hypothetical protein